MVFSHFHSFRIAYRNPITHPGIMFTEADARDLFNVVSAFLRQLAKQMTDPDELPAIVVRRDEDATSAA